MPSNQAITLTVLTLSIKFVMCLIVQSVKLWSTWSTLTYFAQRNMCFFVCDSACGHKTVKSTLGELGYVQIMELSNNNHTALFLCAYKLEKEKRCTAHLNIWNTDYF